jgi:hypothetical protein
MINRYILAADSIMTPSSIDSRCILIVKKLSHHRDVPIFSQ